MKMSIFWDSSVDYIKLAGNCFLCLSALLILIDFGPYDLISSYSQQIAAINTLKTYEFIVGRVDRPVNWSNFSPTVDIDVFETLTKLVRERSPKASQVDWSRAIAIRYHTISTATAEGVEMSKGQPLTIVLRPAKGNMVETTNVGALSDLDTWLSLDHQVWLNRTALFLLMLGFLLQSLESLWGMRQKRESGSQKRWRRVARRLRPLYGRRNQTSQKVIF